MLYFLYNLKYQRAVGLLLCLLCSSFLSAKAQYFELDGSAGKRVIIPFRFVRSMIIVKLKVNNRGPYNFILDTGVGLMIITDPKLADSINLNVKRTIKIAGFGEGDDYEAYITPQMKIDIPGLVSRGVSAAILKKDHFGLSSYAGMPIHGLLGYDFFSKLSVKVNFSDSTLTVSEPKDMRIFRRAIRIPITIEDRKPYMEAKVMFGNGTEKTSKLVVDLGAGHSVSFENVKDINALQSKCIDANLGVGINGLISGSISRINDIGIGKYKIKDIIASFPDPTTKTLAVKRDGNLGMGLLKKFNIIFDYYNNAMYLKPNEYFRENMEHDMSGLGFYSAGNEYSHIIVDNVEPGSAGEEAGIQKDDEIVAINFKPVNKMNMQQIDDLFKSKDGRSFLLDIYHDKKIQRVVLTLKRRI